MDFRVIRLRSQFGTILDRPERAFHAAFNLDPGYRKNPQDSANVEQIGAAIVAGQRFSIHGRSLTIRVPTAVRPENELHRAMKVLHRYA